MFAHILRKSKKKYRSSEKHLHVGLLQLRRLAAARIKAINRLADKLLFSFSILLKRERTAQSPSKPSPQRLHCAAPTRGGGGRKEPSLGMSDTKARSCTVLSMLAKVRELFLPFLTSKEANAAKICSRSQTAKETGRKHQKTSKVPSRKSNSGTAKRHTSLPHPMG